MRLFGSVSVYVCDANVVFGVNETTTPLPTESKQTIKQALCIHTVHACLNTFRVGGREKIECMRCFDSQLINISIFSYQQLS